MKALSIASLALLALTGTASAQYASSNTDTSLYNVSLRLGALVPLDNKLDDRVGGLMSVGLDYHLERSLFPGSSSYLSVDWVSDSVRAKKNLFPIFLNQKFGLGEGSTAYAVVGVGAMIVDLDRSGTRFGLRGGVGTTLGDNYFAEAIATFSDAVKGVRGNTIGVYVGYRF